MKIYREITGDDDPAFYAEDGIGTPLKEKKPRRIWAVPVDGPVYLWCKTHARIPEDGIDLCGDEWRDIGECVFVRAMLVEVGEDSTP